MTTKKAPRTMSLREAKARLSEAVSASQGTYVLLTRHGKPAALIVGVDGNRRARRGEAIRVDLGR
jgi:prevent-host-death family protein